MTKIMFYGTRDYEKNDALNWGKANNVEVVTTEEILSEDTVDLAKGFDGVTTMQFGKFSRLCLLNLKNMVLNKLLNVLLVSTCTI